MIKRILGVAILYGVVVAGSMILEPEMPLAWVAGMIAVIGLFIGLFILGMSLLMGD